MSIATFTIRIGGVLTNVASAVLSDPTGTYGIKRNDTGAVVVADGTALTNTAVGVYQHTFADPVFDLEYTSWLEFVRAGATVRAEKVFLGPLSAVATDLTTVVNCKTYMNITIATYDALLLELVSAATDLIESYCKRQFMSRTYTCEIYDGSDSDTLLLNQYPVTALTRCNTGRLDVIAVTNTLTDALSATVSISGLAATLVVTGGAGAGSNAVDWATYTTLTAVVAQINTLGTGWTASLQSSATGTYPSTELIPAGAMVCLGNNAYLDLPDPTGLTDYTIHWDEGMLEIGGTWGTTSQDIFVDYVAGYAVLPDDLEVAAKDVVATMYRRREHDLSLKSERLGDYAYTLADIGSDLPVTVMATLNRYRNRRI